MSDDELHRARSYFFTSTPPVEPSYCYSGAFGAPFAGLGMGLPLTSLYVRALGGRLDIVSVEGIGTTAFARAGKLGRVNV